MQGSRAKTGNKTDKAPASMELTALWGADSTHVNRETGKAITRVVSSREIGGGGPLQVSGREGLSARRLVAEKEPWSCSVSEDCSGEEPVQRLTQVGPGVQRRRRR